MKTSLSSAFTRVIPFLVLVVSGCFDIQTERAFTRGLLPVPRFEPDSTSDFPVAVPSNYESTTGYLVVLEDREQVDGPTIRLPVAIVRGKSIDAASNPVLYLGGGPGSSAIGVAAYPGAYPFTDEHDFVILEQRGTRFSDPALECPEFDSVSLKNVRIASSEDRLEARVSATRQCKKRLDKAGVNRAAYSTASSAADIEDLRGVLGVEKWTLYGVSYGTRLALSVVRSYPKSVKAMVLDSVLPPQARYDDESVLNLQSALDLVFRDCQVAPSCRAAFPKLRGRFYRALEEADADPIVITLLEDDETMIVSLRAADLVNLIDLSTPNGIARAPLLIDGIARRDTSLLKTVTEGQFTASAFAWGMRLSVWCSESLPYSARAAVSLPGSTLGGLESAAVHPEVCQEWDVPIRPRVETSPVTSDVPTLLISGEYDPNTPPAWAVDAAQTLSMGRVVVFPGSGHTPMQNWSGDGCAMRVATEFIESPSDIVGPTAELPSCVAEQLAPVFVTGNDQP